MLRALTALSMLAIASTASAQDGAYGRLDRDLTLEAGLGGGVAFEPGTGPLGAGTLELRARYLDMAGVVLGGEVRPNGTSRVFVGGDLRPLFLARFLLNASFHDRFWDLLLDSIGVDLGVAFLPLDQHLGAALMVGFGLDVPLVFFGEGVDGISLRLAGRHVAALPTDRLGPSGGADDWIGMAALVFRGGVQTGLPGLEPRRYEVRSD